MKTKILSLAFLMMTGLGVFAQPGMNKEIRITRGPQNSMAMRADHQAMAKALNLTDEQKEAFKKIMLATHKEILPVRNEIGEAVAHQKTLISAEKPDMTAINKNIDRIGALKIELAKIEIKHRLEMRALLTDEQRLKFEGWKERMKHPMGQNFRRPGMGMNPEMNMN
jgi:Spy/CpxP family protein refolding chaperone